MKTITKIAAAGFLICTSAHQLICTSAVAQDLSNNYQYLFSKYNINPAYAGYDGKTHLLIGNRSSFRGLKESANNTMLTMDGSLNEQNAIGFKMLNDVRGVFRTLSSEFAYAYKLKINNDHKLAFGLSGGFVQRTLNTNNTQYNSYVDKTDYTLSADYFSKTNFISSAGFLYTWDDALQVGLSAPHLIEAKSRSQVSDHIILTAAYTYEINEDWAVKPLVMYQNLPNKLFQYEAGAMVSYKNILALEGRYRSNKTYNAIFKFNHNNIFFGYGMGISGGEVQELAKLSHELALGFTIHKKKVAFWATKQIDKSFLSKFTKKDYEDNAKLDSLKIQLDGLIADPSKYSQNDIREQIKAISKELEEALKDNEHHPVETQKKLADIRSKIKILYKKYYKGDL